VPTGIKAILPQRPRLMLILMGGGVTNVHSARRSLGGGFLTSVRLFEAVVVVSAIVLALLTLPRDEEVLTDPLRLAGVAFWTLTTALVELLPVPIWKSLQVGTGFPLFTAVAFIYPPPVAAIIAILGSSDPRELRRQVRFLRALFNRGQLGLALFAASSVFHLFGVSVETWSWRLGWAVPLAVLCFYIVNVTLVSSALSLEHRVPFLSIFRKMRIGNPVEFLVSYFGLGLLGVIVANLYLMVGWWAVAAFVMPLLLARQMFFRTRALENATKELQDREVVLRALSNRMAEERQDERKAIAGYLHDDLAQVLYRMALHLDISEKHLEMGEAGNIREELAGIRASRDRAMELIRALIRDLHRSPLGRAGLSEALTSYAHETERDTGVNLRTELEPVDMAPPIQLLCYHVAREAVNNAIKHSEASTITISLERTADGARLNVSDDGKGFDVEEGEPEGHYGLTMMKERAQVAGGEFTIRSARGEGTTVTADFPTSWMVEPDGRGERADGGSASAAPA
jgi:signal transduction histidine kinase